MAQSQENQPLIDSSEAVGLKNGRIDRVKDNGINTIADLTVFLNEQREQAIRILREKANMFFRSDTNELSEAGQQALDEAILHINQVYESTIGDLTVASIRISCSKLADIVGFKLEIDDDFVDQFGLTKRYQGQETRRSSGFAEYRKEYMKGNTVSVEEGEMEAQVRRLALARLFDTRPEDIDKTLAGLKNQGTAEYKEFATSGPVLVLLPEMHYDAGILQNNVDALLELQPLISVLGTEGSEGELKQGDNVKANSKESYQSKIARNEVEISSEAIEGILGNKVYTLGLDNVPILRYILEQLVALKYSDPSDDVLTKMQADEQPSIKKKDLRKFAQEQVKVLLGPALVDLAIFYRNQLWLHSLQTSFLENSDQHSSKSNIAFLVCGAAHIEDLAAQAKHFGFKGVIVFTPRSFDEIVDPKTVKAYEAGFLKVEQTVAKEIINAKKSRLFRSEDLIKEIERRKKLRKQGGEPPLYGKATG